VAPFVLLGVPPRGHKEGDLPTVIGAGATIRSHTVIYAGNRIGRGFQTGTGLLIRESNDIGDDVSIGSGTVIEHHVTIGHGVRIHSGAFIPEYSTLEEGCWIGPCVVLTNAKYPCSPEAKKNLKGPTCPPRGENWSEQYAVARGGRGRRRSGGGRERCCQDVAPQRVPWWREVRPGL
jgi:UDP-3-O-[3-hydroxymyristoyl] glucosamine N-acyltransferase